MQIWQPLELQIDEHRAWSLGVLDLWVERRKKEWRVSLDRRPHRDAIPGDIGTGNGTIPPPAELSWARFEVGDLQSRLQIRPAMPDRPLVIRPEHQLRVAPDCTCEFYVRIGMCVQVLVGDKGEFNLGAHPTVILSKTWLGTPIEGELCYAVKTTARREVDTFEPAPFRITCPVSVRNESNSFLTVDRLCVHGDYLGIHADQTGRMWATPTHLVYSGVNGGSDVSYGHGAPAPAVNAVELAKPRKTADSNVLSRGFSTFRHLADIQLWPS